MNLNEFFKRFSDGLDETITPTLERRVLLDYFNGKANLSDVVCYVKVYCEDSIISNSPTVYDTERFKMCINQSLLTEGEVDEIIITELSKPSGLHIADGRNDKNHQKITKTKSYRALEELISDKYPINIYISGETGLGKSTSVFAIAEKFNKPVIRVNLSGATDLDDLIGGIRIIDGNTIFDPGPVAIAMELGAILLLDECLSEDEKVRIGTIDDWLAIPLKELEKDTKYSVVSFNESTKTLENDSGYIISDKIDDLYEIVLDDGRTIIANNKHPFFDVNGQQVTIEDNSLHVDTDLLVV
jgi:hypothetical protein